MNRLIHFRIALRTQQCTYQSRLMSSSVDLHFTEYEGDNTYNNNKSSSPLIIAHGMLGSSKNWTSLAKRINQATGKRILSIDARNHGESPHTPTISYEEMVNDLVRLYEKLNISKASILGHSMGGRTAMGLSLLHEELIDKLIVVDVSPVTDRDTVEAISGMMIYFKGLSQVVIPSSDNMAHVRKSVDQQLTPFVPDPGMRAWLAMNLYQKRDGNVDWRINIKTISEGFKKDLAFFPQEWKDLKTNVPTLFIGGGKSEYIRRSDHSSIKTQFTSSEIKYIQGAGHWVHAEKPAEFLDLVLKFI
ncbi:sn-1-specific diacylglycerol lipase ABHD11 [Lepeophtheirus salmonis]|uniref:sn-1-specific diacylglycerol lipase ABHD11 n=1 Tax=Lepeophtheirus salmonis TaxID=72036 RepID=UPI001AE2B1B2|nr:protein ABHD11-like [Lepeophtheirus salmonis]